jgi:predicted amidohydrolase
MSAKVRLCTTRAVLLDRDGYLAGKYRKVYLPREEMEQLTPGNDYPVFHTDFGTLGIMTCYDVAYADAARGLARERGSAAIATIDLNKCLRQPNNNLGDMRNRLPKELRLDVATGIPGAK